MSSVSLELAKMAFEDYKGQLVDKVADSLQKAFDGERIGQERAERIVTKFVDNMKDGGVKE